MLAGLRSILCRLYKLDGLTLGVGAEVLGLYVGHLLGRLFRCRGYFKAQTDTECMARSEAAQGRGTTFFLCLNT